MAMTFDAAIKDLARTHAADFVTRFDKSPPQEFSLLNVDLSSISKAADLIVGLEDPLKEIIHFDFQTSASATKHADILVYNSLLHRHYLVPVHSVVILLRPQAAHRNMSGHIGYAPRSSRGKMDFGYELISLWEIPAEELLQGGLGTIPLAPLGKLPADVPEIDGLASVIQKVVDRLIQAPEESAKQLLTTAYLLTGLRVDKATVKQLYQGVQAMHESSAYEAILDEGREKEAKRVVMLLGEDFFGPPTESYRSKLNAITDIDRLEELAKRIHRVSSWQELLD